MIDEADTFLGDKQELRGILNSGHDREFAYVTRVVGEDHEPRNFCTFAPMVVAMIGTLPPTLSDRSINVRMARKSPAEHVQRFTSNNKSAMKELASKMARWTADHLEYLKSASPNLPNCLNDRAADNWRPLLAIADEAGGEWPERAREAAKRLCAAEGNEDAHSTGALLLKDIKEFFDRTGREKVSSETLANELGAMEERPWSEFGKNQKPITKNAIARLLKPYRIRPHTVRLGTEILKGYETKDFEDAFQRYLTPVQSVTPSQPHGENGFGDFSNRNSGRHVTDGKCDSSYGEKKCDDVTVQSEIDREVEIEV